MKIDKLIFPKNTRFLVTGAAGFIGSNLVEFLLENKYSVRGLDNFSTGLEANLSEMLIDSNFELIQGDIKDFETCLKACENIDFVLHQAALGSVPRSMNEPMIYEENNIKGTANMMEAARQCEVKRFIYASSSSVYGDSSKLPKMEGEEGNILSPYALTKLTNELYGKMYTEIFNLECIGLRYFNVFGKRQDPNSLYAAVLPKFVKKTIQNERVEIYGDGNQSRDFTYIENVIDANLKACLAPKLACGKAFNIATGEKISINQLYEYINFEFSTKLTPIYSAPREGDIKHSLANISKAKEEIFYNPKWNFASGFKETLKWYKKNL